MHRADSGRLQRVTDRQIALGREGYREPDGGRLGDQSDRVDVRNDVRIDKLDVGGQQDRKGDQKGGADEDDGVPDGQR